MGIAASNRSSFDLIHLFKSVKTKEEFRSLDNFVDKPPAGTEFEINIMELTVPHEWNDVHKKNLHWFVYLSKHFRLNCFSTSLLINVLGLVFDTQDNPCFYNDVLKDLAATICDYSSREDISRLVCLIATADSQNFQFSETGKNFLHFLGLFNKEEIIQEMVHYLNNDAQLCNCFRLVGRSVLNSIHEPIELKRKLYKWILSLDFKDEDTWMTYMKIIKLENHLKDYALYDSQTFPYPNQGEFLLQFLIKIDGPLPFKTMIKYIRLLTVADDARLDPEIRLDDLFKNLFTSEQILRIFEERVRQGETDPKTIAANAFSLLKQIPHHSGTVGHIISKYCAQLNLIAVLSWKSLLKVFFSLKDANPAQPIGLSLAVLNCLIQNSEQLRKLLFKFNNFRREVVVKHWRCTYPEFLSEIKAEKHDPSELDINFAKLHLNDSQQYNDKCEILRLNGIVVRSIAVGEHLSKSEFSAKVGL